VTEDAALSDAAISAVNYSGVLKKTIERNAPIQPVLDFMNGWTLVLSIFIEGKPPLRFGGHAWEFG
jgi:hypothetical protein